MKTAHEQVVILFQALADSALKQAVAGRVYLYKQPSLLNVDSVVVNALPVNNSQFQLGTANVNIYAPDQLQKIEGKDQAMPDVARLNELTQLALVPLEELYTSVYRFEVANISGPIDEEETKKHYINLRIEFEFFPES